MYNVFVNILYLPHAACKWAKYELDNEIFYTNNGISKFVIQINYSIGLDVPSNTLIINGNIVKDYNVVFRVDLTICGSKLSKNWVEKNVIWLVTVLYCQFVFVGYCKFHFNFN